MKPVQKNIPIVVARLLFIATVYYCQALICQSEISVCYKIN